MAARHCQLRQPPRSPITCRIGKVFDRASSPGASSSLSRPRAWPQTPTARRPPAFPGTRVRQVGPARFPICTAAKADAVQAAFACGPHSAGWALFRSLGPRLLTCSCRADCGRCTRGPSLDLAAASELDAAAPSVSGRADAAGVSAGGGYGCLGDGARDTTDKQYRTGTAAPDFSEDIRTGWQSTQCVEGTRVERSPQSVRPF